MRIHLRASQRPNVEARLRRFELLVVVPRHLRHVCGFEKLNRLPARHAGLISELLNLVAQAPALHRAAEDLAHVPLDIHLRLVLVAHVHRRHRRELLVAAQEEPRLYVFLGSHLEVGLEVVHRVLRYVAHAQVMVLPHGALTRNELTDDVLEQRGLTRAVRADDGHAGVEVHPAVDVVENRLGLGPGVREREIFYPQNHVRAAPHAVQLTGFRERDQRLVSGVGFGEGCARHRRREGPDGSRVSHASRGSEFASQLDAGEPAAPLPVLSRARVVDVAAIHRLADRLRVRLDRPHHVPLHAG